MLEKAVNHLSDVAGDKRNLEIINEDKSDDQDLKLFLGNTPPFLFVELFEY